MLNFTHEDDFKILNKYFAGISRTLCISTDTIRRSRQSRETIPLELDAVGSCVYIPNR
jgi:hypothetical protein